MRFVQGYGKHSADLEPVKVVKNPDGSLAQAALMQVCSCLRLRTFSWLLIVETDFLLEI